MSGKDGWDTRPKDVNRDNGMTSGVVASKADLVVARNSERAKALIPVPCVYELNPVAFIS